MGHIDQAAAHRSRPAPMPPLFLRQRQARPVKNLRTVPKPTTRLNVERDFTQQFGFDFGHPLVVDLFAGGGGASTGIEAAFGRPVDIAVNHAEDAIASGESSPYDTLHVVCLGCGSAPCRGRKAGLRLARKPGLHALLSSKGRSTARRSHPVVELGRCLVGRYGQADSDHTRERRCPAQVGSAHREA